MSPHYDDDGKPINTHDWIVPISTPKVRSILLLDDQETKDLIDAIADKVVTKLTRSQKIKKKLEPLVDDEAQ